MTNVEKVLKQSPHNKRYITVISIILVLLFAWSVSSISLKGLQESGLKIGLGILGGIVNPDFELLFDLADGVPYLLVETISIAFLGTIIGAILAIPFAFLSASNLVSKPVSLITRMMLIFIRTVPEIVYGLMFIRVTGPGPFAGVLTISFISIGMLARLYVDAIEELDTSVLESMSSIGCSTFEKIRYGILPQLFSIFLSIMIYRFDMNLREAAILGLVGAGGIGAPLIFAMNSYKWNQVGSILIGLVVLILLVELFSNKVRGKLIRG
ncbi:MAG TPA: phosphonate ABC transporter, permease protein PhnE [Virgibacillus sp.]|nr:phosphonate ABC transporter, permease protein PhnE [Virgibacillus sp.]